MAEWRWIVHDPAGRELRTTEPLPSREEAEAWMGIEWSSLLDEGGESVTLVGDGERAYTMGLTEE